MTQEYCFLVFGEDDNDRRAIMHLVRALTPPGTAVTIEARRQPVVLSRDAVKSGKRRAMSADIAEFWRAERVRGRRVIVVVHRDCDDIEPAHMAETEALLRELEDAGVNEAVIAAPAWEIEAWWMLFPRALQATRACWRVVDYGHQHVGLIQNAKERLRRDLRPLERAARQRCKDFVESDGIRVAEEILKGDLLRQAIRSRSDSFQSFKAGVEAIFA